MDNFMLKLDEFVTDLFGQWDIYTTIIAGSIVTFTIYSIVNSRDPDAHPMLLARQAQASPVRQEGESSVYRCHSAPHGTPLASGLNVKDATDSKWSRGRDGDLRDIWQRVVTGKVDAEGTPAGEKGRLLTILGSEKTVDHNLSDVSRQINLIGQHLKQNGGKNVAIYLPNSVEFLATLFACAFYDLDVTLVPYDQPIDQIISFLKQSKSDAVVAAVGSFPFDVVSKSYPALKQLVWVVDDGSKHMDWNEVPTGTGGPVNVSTWQEIIQDASPSSGADLPAIDRTIEPKKVMAFSPAGELVEYTHANIVAGVAGQLYSVPTTQRLKPTDLFLPVVSLATIFPLTLTLAALYSNASVALNSVAVKNPDLVLATQGVAPTVIVASPETMAKVLSETTEKMSSPVYRIIHSLQTRTLHDGGVLPSPTMFSRLFDSLRPIIGNVPGQLRLIYIPHQIGADSPPLSAKDLSDLRIYTGSRIVYALTSPKVAGAITQSAIYDYRVDKSSGNFAHFGPPVTSVEILLKDTAQHKTTNELSIGELYAGGPAVVGGMVSMGVNGKINGDHTFGLL
ncbi:hypothetical protein HYFRA_00003733 [Hymenoscyphus fraxineus]|uniref:AMP-dependent synthetase/ligase domain-containing protein n=1 Tax=Hymenoscyphus fraxineus TaxID=746836 RepID=A0A9N9L3I9_9HELO|nr:hypothetical protein HYFRA_00003733 [Hymenoscyphus fraxineus]